MYCVATSSLVALVTAATGLLIVALLTLRRRNLVLTIKIYYILILSRITTLASTLVNRWGIPNPRLRLG
jgi:hypothetical protein